MKDALGERIKNQYEDRSRFSLPRRTYTILRLDGKAFHTYTKHLEKPFDKGLFEDMDIAIMALCKEVQGVVFAYTQSDEISLLLTDFATPNTCAWFDGNIQKMVSVSSSIMTAEFNRYRAKRWATAFKQARALSATMDDEVAEHADIHPFNLAFFDARVFTIPDPTEVYNYFVWRQQDCIRNSVSMVAQSLYSHKELHGKSQNEMLDMIIEKDSSWALDFPKGFKFGRLIKKELYNSPERYITSDPCNPNVERTRWISEPASKFTDHPPTLQNMIPNYE